MDDAKITIKRWLQKADNDLKTAIIMNKEKDPPTDVVCFHCQQCAEKCLKAYLVSVEHDFPKTHDLEHLISLCVIHDKTFKEIEEHAIAITDYAVETRYVDEWREISQEESIRAIDRAQKIKDFVAAKKIL